MSFSLSELVLLVYFEVVYSNLELNAIRSYLLFIVVGTVAEEGPQQKGRVLTLERTFRSLFSLPNVHSLKTLPLAATPITSRVPHVQTKSGAPGWCGAINEVSDLALLLLYRNTMGSD